MICSVLYNSIENQKKDAVRSLTFKMFPMPNIHILTLMTSRCKGKKEKVYEKCSEKNAIISRGALNCESLA